MGVGSVRRVASAAAMAMIVTVLALPVSAVPPTIDALEATVAWSGAFEDTVGVAVPELYPAACEALDCETFILTVALPDGFWDAHDGGVQVAVDWFPHEENDLDLYVYGPDGSLAGRSDGFFASTGEATRIADAANGDYTVVVVPRLVDGMMSFHGFAEVELAPSVEPVRTLEPNLVALPARNPHLRTGAYLFDHGVEGTPSCYPEETAEQGAMRCLRFDQIIANEGEGPLELRYRMEGLATEQRLTQRLYRSDGTTEERFADTYEFHPAHAHFHYKSFGQSKLYRESEDGRLELVREGRKNGFCMIDVENTRFGTDEGGEARKGEAPRTYYFPRCNAPTERDASGTFMTNGISVGWADVYNWFLADQFIEITGVPDGEYVLETIANPGATVVESDMTDNASRIRIRLTGDQVEIVS